MDGKFNLRHIFINFVRSINLTTLNLKLWRIKSKDTNEVKVNDDTSQVFKSNGTIKTDDFIEDTTPNPVGELLEVTQRFSLRPPEFEFVDEEG